MEGWYQAARQIDQGLEQMKNAQAGFYTTSRNTQPATANHDPDKMDVDRIGIKRLTTQERERYFKEGRCFKCGQKGHRANECQKGTPNYAQNKNPGRNRFFNRDRQFTRNIPPGRSIRQTETEEAKEEENPPKPPPKPRAAEPQTDPTKERAASIRAILSTLKPEEQDTVFNLLAEEGF